MLGKTDWDCKVGWKVIKMAFWILIVIMILSYLQCPPIVAKEIPEGKIVTNIGCTITEVQGKNIMPTWNVSVKLTFSDGTHVEKMYAIVPIEDSTDKAKDKAEEKAYKKCVEWKKKVREEIKAVK